jgi:outer membrane protein assembly factor BamB
MRIRLLSAGIAILLVASTTLAGDWPQFRGPNRNGVSDENGLLRTWPKDGPKLIWSFKNAGLGFSSMAIVGDKLYTLGSRGNDEIVLALDANKGTELWTSKIGPVVNAPENFNWGDGPRATPTIDGKYLYALGSQGELVCLDISGAQSKEIWRKNLVKDFGGEMMSGWGFSESPLVDGKLLIVTPGGAQGTLAAMDKLTGALVWRSTELKHLAPYTSVTVAEINGQRQYIQTSSTEHQKDAYLNAFSPKDGKLLWSTSFHKGDLYLIASDPIVKGNLVYLSAGDSVSLSFLFEINKDNSVKQRYSKANQKKMKNNHGGVVMVDTGVFGYSDGAGWAAQDYATGKQLWVERNELEASGSGATIAVDGMLYLYTDKGEVGLVKADPKGFELAGSFKIPETSKFPGTRKTSSGAKAWSHPAVANGHLYVRDCEFIYCYDVRDKK